VDPLSALLGLEQFGMKFGLESISRLCEALDHPERSFRSVLVAGTNGKGSVTAMVETALRSAGHRAARYTSPHLTRLEERFVIDGREVETPELADAAARVMAAVNDLLRSGTLAMPPTFFEAVTATAFELFRRRGAEIAVLEVGLGGRLDATNVVTPIVAAITSLDFDHQAQLGDTLEAIAREKAGVIKPGVPVVCGPLPEAADSVVAEVARAQDARMVRALEAVRVTSRESSGGFLYDFRSNRRTLDGVTLALAGRHQADNAAVALCVLDELTALGVRSGDADVRAGLARVQWPGRLEEIADGASRILLDAAHNPAGARALVQHLRDIGWTDVALVFGVMRDKDAGAMLEALAPVCRAIVCTTAAGGRAMPAADLAAVARRVAAGTAVEAVEDPAAALARARALSDRVVTAGSIFLIGPLRGILC
jgi:dihydrofolate synthase/folylpolyglutamate synthase